MIDINVLLNLAVSARQSDDEDIVQIAAKKIEKRLDAMVELPVKPTFELVAHFTHLGLDECAARVFCVVFKKNIPFSQQLLEQLLVRLRQRGLWAEHNSLYAEFILRSATHLRAEGLAHFLEQLDFKNFCRLVSIENCANEVDNFADEKCCYNIASASFHELSGGLQLSYESILSIFAKPRLRKWCYLYFAHQTENWGEEFYRLTAATKLSSNEVLEHFSEILKICWSRGWEGLAQRVVFDANSDGFPAATLRKNLVFCRAYVFSCERFDLENALLKTILSASDPVFDSNERWAVNFKKKALRVGAANALSAQFGKIEVTAGDYIEIPLIVYGQSYVASLREFFLESAINSADFKLFPKATKPVISIFTTEEYSNQISDILKPLVSVGYQLNINRRFFVSESECAHLRMWFVIDSMCRVERNNGVYVMLCPDSVFGDGLSSLIKNCPVDGGAGGNLIRGSWGAMAKSSARGEISQILKSPTKNYQIAQLATTKWKHFYQRLYSENLTENIVSKIVNGSQQNGWMGVPHILKPREGFTDRLLKSAIYRYSNVYSDHLGQIIDHELVGQLVAANKLYMTRSYEEFVFVEMANDMGYSQLWKSKFPIGFTPGKFFGRTMAID